MRVHCQGQISQVKARLSLAELLSCLSPFFLILTYDHLFLSLSLTFSVRHFLTQLTDSTMHSDCMSNVL